MRGRAGPATYRSTRNNDLGALAHPETLRAIEKSGRVHHGPSELLPRRLEELGLDGAFLKYARMATYRDMERVCGTCKAWRRCARDLAKGMFRPECGAIVTMPRQSMRRRSIESSPHAPSHAAARRSDINLGPRDAIEIGDRPGRSATVRIAICGTTGPLTHEAISQ